MKASPPDAPAYFYDSPSRSAEEKTKSNQMSRSFSAIRVGWVAGSDYHHSPAAAAVSDQLHAF